MKIEMDSNTVSGIFLVGIILLCILFGGEPDIADGVISG